ncbi:glycoside hydrolase family 20 protein [Gonapodya prolifera JEL478]|uniref:beta-N-acetylhexosaminidase n=1 Tax=Gonapodya prolifera (strain JEL478) TaxID=1344416 RepID=A0A139AKQ8_GONPJ|nr:glycoside hydrolase family 20 protein [Gonapodya prolifera JEL478]|eukprot:KXS17369.1 glycoside hydrolase family 20 protein [Gonapodya prolifera JEL478]
MSFPMSSMSTDDQITVDMTLGDSQALPEADAINQDEGAPFRQSISIIANVFPPDLAPGLAQIERTSPHNNFFVGSAGNTDMTVDDSAQEPEKSSSSEVQWFLRLNQSHEYPVGYSSVRSSHQRFREVPVTGRFEIEIRYNRKIEAFRSIGRVLTAAYDAHLSGSDDMSTSLNYDERAEFDSLGIMLDCSRCAVPNITTISTILVRCALLGFNTLQLYTEDTYQVKGEPFFGYFRGGYTEAELSEVDRLGYELGIEVFPNIQMLGHMGQVLQWPRFYNIRDNSEVLLPSDPQAFQLIRSMLHSATSPFRSKKIHLGMDEAAGVGEGRYRQIYGYKEPVEVFKEHLRNVVNEVEAIGREPLVWSDMLFCLPAGSTSLSSYYDSPPITLPAPAPAGDPHSLTPVRFSASELPPTAVRPSTPGGSSLPTPLPVALPTPTLPEPIIPRSCQLVYWDYYHTHNQTYARKLREHRSMHPTGRAPWFAGAAWTWSRFWCAQGFGEKVGTAAVRACKEEGVRDVFVTCWGDDGGECELFSALPTLVFWSRHAYTSSPSSLPPDYTAPDDRTVMRSIFAAVCGGDWDAFAVASAVDELGGRGVDVVEDGGTHFMANTSKWMLWMDPVYGFLDAQLEGYDVQGYYQQIHQSLAKSVLATSQFPLNAVLAFPSQLSLVLSIKPLLRRDLARAYAAGDREAMERGLQRAKWCREEAERLREVHLGQWGERNKVFGGEILEFRHAALLSRLSTLISRVSSFLSGRSPSIPEFEVEPQRLWPDAGVNLLLDYARAMTPCRAMGQG